jgi:hypothetical protein
MRCPDKDLYMNVVAASGIITRKWKRPKSPLRVR